MPFCENCGNEISESAKFCSECGTPNNTNFRVRKSLSKFFTRRARDNSSTIIEDTGRYGLNTSQLPIATIIDDRYKIEKKLGVGGFGTVYKAWDQHIKCWKALKVIHTEFYDEKEVIHDLTKEAKLLMDIHAENIVRLWDVHLQGEIKYIDMEYIDDGDLVDLKLKYSDKRVPEKVVLDLAKQIAIGMSKIHECNILHKDLKPQNIMLTKKGIVKIMDFGISETFSSSVSRLQSTSRSGTPRYMAPEQILGVDVGKEADIWSYGIIIYELLNGKQPFVAESRNDVLLQIENREFKALDAVSNKVNGLLYKCLQKEYKERFSSFAKISDYLNNDAIIEIVDKLNVVNEQSLSPKDQHEPKVMAQQPKLPDHILNDFNNVLKQKKEEVEANIKKQAELDQLAKPVVVDVPARTIETKEMTQEMIKEFWAKIDVKWRDAFARSLGRKSIGLADISDILNITELEKEVFRFDRIGINNLEILSYLTKLKKLYLKTNELAMSGLSHLQDLFTLEELEIYHTHRDNGSYDLDELKSLVNLKNIKIHFIKINSLFFLQNLLNLEELTLSCTWIESLRGIEDCLNLKQIEIDYFNVKDLTPIMHLSKLEKLTIPKGVDTFDFELNHPDCEIHFSE